MHLPDGVISEPVCLVANGLAATAVGYSAWRVGRDGAASPPAKWALVAAGVFAVQLLNFPLSGGASGHLIGAVFAGALLGPWSGILVVSAVLAIQAIVFGDGGIATLGANILNMAVVGAGIGGWCRKQYARPRAAALGAVAAVPIGAALCATQLAIGAARPLGEAILALVPFHAALGLIEGGATALALTLFASLTPEQRPFSTVRWSSLALLAVLFFAPLASALPDGLEAGMIRLGLTANASLPQWIFAPDYLVSGFENESWALILGAGIGMLSAAACALILGTVARMKAVSAARTRDFRRITSP
jgi:cobalt/nickel transport system permease protein